MTGLSYAQRRLWFLDRLLPGTPAYNLGGAFRVRGRLDEAALDAALQEVVRRHSALRTTFRAAGGVPAQVVLPAPELRLERTDLGGLPAGRREAAARARVREEVGRPFDLGAGPPVRARLLVLAEDDHALVVTTHHIVSDGWSMGILWRELGALYGGARLPEPAFQLADAVEAERRRLAGPGFDAHLDYWRGQLAGLRSAPILPADRPRPPVQALRGARHAFALSPELSAELRALARRERVTLFITMLAAFQALLHRYTGERDVVVAAPTANRGRPEAEGVIGCLVNTLVLRTDLSGDPAFHELLGRVRRVARDAYAHQDVPFERLVEELGPERDLGHQPLAQVALLVHLPGTYALDLPGLDVTPMDTDRGTAKYDLALAVTDAGGGLRLELEYDADLFEPATIERLAGHLDALLRGIAAGPDRAVSRLPLLTERERARQVAGAGAVPAAPHPLVHELVAAWAARAPGRPALVQGPTTVTYGELDRRAGRLAERLRGLGVGPESAVAVTLDRSPDAVVACLAVLKAGGAYLALDPAQPGERLERMLADARPAAVLTRDGLTGGPQAAGPPAAGARPAPLSPAYVVYTSGSTGAPKAVVVTHEGLSNLVAWTADACGIAPGDRMAWLAAIDFDASVFELWPYLATGARVHLPDDEDVRLAPERLRDWLVERGVTICHVTTALAERLVELDWPEDARLRLLLTGGDRLRRHPPPAFPAALVNNYGPTEVSVIATSGRVPAAGMGAPRIGRPVPGAEVHVLDRHLEPVPVGVPGELLVGGAGLARGYLDRPGPTAERFVPHPFGRPGDRLYRTGDRVRALPGGELEFIGRMDQQVKIRGYRVEPGEVEAVLGGHPAVGEAAVAAREDGRGDRRLVAYVVPRPDGPAPGPGELRTFLEGRLPAYMVPAAFVRLARLPLSPHGKVDRAALPPPSAADLAVAADRTAAADPVEERLARIWADVLEVERVGVHDNFFRLGGHSLLGTVLLARVQDAFGVELPVRSLFDAPTVAGLAAVIRGRGR